MNLDTQTMGDLLDCDAILRDGITAAEKRHDLTEAQRLFTERLVIGREISRRKAVLSKSYRPRPDDDAQCTLAGG